MALLIQNQAAFVARMANIDERVAKMDERFAKTDERFLKIDERFANTDRINSERFARIEALLLEHNRILTALPEVIREKIGFKAPPS